MQPGSSNSGAPRMGPSGNNGQIGGQPTSPNQQLANFYQQVGQPASQAQLWEALQHQGQGPSGFYPYPMGVPGMMPSSQKKKKRKSKSDKKDRKKRKHAKLVPQFGGPVGMAPWSHYQIPMQNQAGRPMQADNLMDMRRQMQLQPDMNPSNLNHQQAPMMLPQQLSGSAQSHIQASSSGSSFLPTPSVLQTSDKPTTKQRDRSQNPKQSHEKPTEQPSMNKVQIHSYNIGGMMPMPYGMPNPYANWPGSSQPAQVPHSGQDGFVTPGFYPNPTNFYNDQLMRNYANVPSSQVLSLNKKKMKEFRKEAKMKKKKRKEKEKEKKKSRLNGRHRDSPDSPRPSEYRVNSENQGKFCHESSMYKGVSWDATNGCYQARVWHRGKSEALGSFKEELKAAVAVDLKLVGMGLSDSKMFNFETALVRDIALLIIKHHTNITTRQRDGEEMEEVDTEVLRMLGDNVPRDKNGFPNYIPEVLKNIIKYTSIPGQRDCAAENCDQQTKQRAESLNPQSMDESTMEKTSNLSHDSKQSNSNTQKLGSSSGDTSEVKVSNNSTKGVERKRSDASSNGYSGDVEFSASAKTSSENVDDKKSNGQNPPPKP